MTSPSALLAPRIQTLDVMPIACDGQLVGRGIDAPAPGGSFDGYTLSISGWIHSSPATPVKIHVVSEGRPVATAAVAFPRPDVAAHLRVADQLPLGFLTDLTVLGLPLRFELRLEVELSDGRQFPFAAISGTREPLRSSFRPRICPVFVTNIGRCGSTLLMNLLRRHPRIAVHDLYPYETRALSYWMHMLKVLSEPANHERSANPNSYEDDLFWVGRHPHNMRPVIEAPPVLEFLRRDYVEKLAEFCQSSAEDFYWSVTEAQGVDEPVYAIEKRNPRPTARIASELYPDAREIFLVREPRDMVCSMISFYERTQLVSFGRDQRSDDEEFVSGIAHALRDLVRQLRERREAAILVRYEQLVGDTATTLGRILDYLELPTDADVQREIAAQARASTSDSDRHRTTTDADSSIGRWRRDLSEPMQALCTSAFAETFHELGYEP